MNLFSTFYGGSQSNNTPKKRRGNPSLGSGGVGLVGGPNALIQCNCPNGGNCGPVSNRRQCLRCCRRTGDPFYSLASVDMYNDFPR